MIFDGGMENRDQPAISVATRGLAAFNLRVRTGARDLHSGMYGNAALNAIHALMETLGGILPRDGRVPDALRVGIAPPTDEERAAWEQQPSGADVLRDAGAVPYDERAAEEFYLRTTAETSVDVNGILGGKPGLKNTTLVSEAQANFTVRLAPGQTPEAVAPEVERLLHEAAPAGATVEVEELPGSTRPGLVAADSPVIKIAQDAFEHAFGIRPILTRSGGTLPILPGRAGQGHPDDRHRLLAAREQRPLAERAHAHRVLPAGCRDDEGAVPASWRPLAPQFTSPLAAELAEDVLERLLRYARIDTQSAHTSETYPSTLKQLDLCRLLVDELREAGSRTRSSPSTATSSPRCRAPPRRRRSA